MARNLPWALIKKELQRWAFLLWLFVVWASQTSGRKSCLGFSMGLGPSSTQRLACENWLLPRVCCGDAHWFRDLLGTGDRGEGQDLPSFFNFRHNAPSAVFLYLKTIPFIAFFPDYNNRTCSLFLKMNIYVDREAKLSCNPTTQASSLLFWFISSLFSLKAFMLFPQNCDLPVHSIL